MYLVLTDRIETLQHHNSNLIHKTHPEARTIKSVQTKLKNTNAMITVADKGNSVVILLIQQYETKIQKFLQEIVKAGYVKHAHNNTNINSCVCVYRYL
jgi:hypothetical protein